MRATDRSGLAVMFAIFLATFTVLPITSDRMFLGLTWVEIMILGLISIGLRRFRAGGGTVILVQLLLVGLFSVTVSLTMPGMGAWYANYLDLWTAGTEHMRTQASPMDPHGGVRLMMVTTIGLIFVMTDLLVCGINRPAWAIAPPAALFLIPAIGLGRDTGVINFGCLALGYLAILVAEGLNSSGRWTRGLSRDSAEGFGAAAPVVWRAAGYVCGLAVAATVALGLVLPTISIPGFGVGNGPGGNGPLTLTDPTLDLRRNLTQATDQTVITYETDQQGGVYLRMTSLTSFSGAGWTPVQLKLDPGNNLPPVPGLDQAPDQLRTTRVRIGDFGSQYLPLPYAPRSFETSGEWLHDANSLIVVSNTRARAQDATSNQNYTVTSADVSPSLDGLSTAIAGTPADAAITDEVPDDLPESLIEETKRVIKGAESDAEKASAIQAYLRSSRFTYSTDPQPGTGYRALENFLLEDRLGYCEQFAAAMAMMARVAGIPSRVAVGFLPGELVGAGSYEVSIRDMHAWPELYFSGYGWVRYEPTPSVAPNPPAWTLDQGEDETTTPTDEPTDVPTATAPTQSTAPTQDQTLDPTADAGDTGFPWGRTLIGSGIGLLVLALLAAPATIRVRRRESRLTPSGPAQDRVESAWVEIRDTVVDYGGTWPDGSPRAIGGAVGDQLDTNEAAQLSQVATLVERSRYAQQFDDTDDSTRLPGMTAEIRKGLAPSSRLRRLKAFLLPRSLFRRWPD